MFGELYPSGTPHPDRCPDCGALLLLRANVERPFYGCTNYPKCQGAAGAHPDGRPLGRAVGSKERTMRVLAHRLFKQTQGALQIDRSSVYASLRHHMQMETVHIGTLPLEDLRKMIDTLNLLKKGKLEPIEYAKE